MATTEPGGIPVRVSRGADAEMKRMPQDAATRRAIRDAALEAADGLDRASPPGRNRLLLLGESILRRLALPDDYLGFAMVSVSNEFWRRQFAAVAFRERLLLLPHCLRKHGVCPASYDAVGLHCEHCGSCILDELLREAEALGYRTIVAEGTPAVLRHALAEGVKAVLGVACLDSLDQAFERVSQLGVPNAAVPLLADGCVDTVAELDVLRKWMHARTGPADAATRTYAPLMRHAQDLFLPDGLAKWLGEPEVGIELGLEGSGATSHTARLALEWLANGGKRFRPFITLACYSALAHGTHILRPDSDLAGAFPVAVELAAVAIEALHKASLIHDDIEDDDLYRYGRETLHRIHGVPTAINVGDYLVGLGYRCVCESGQHLGAECAQALTRELGRAHLRLCRGQGAELLHHNGQAEALSPVEMQSIYALKTAPAFHAAMYVGARSAMAEGAEAELDLMVPFSLHVGVAYQVTNDLKDWDDDRHDKLVAGQDILAQRPTMISALAIAAGGPTKCPETDLSVEEQFSFLREAYRALGVFDSARRLVRAYREKALALCDDVRPDSLGEVMRFIAETIL